MNGINRKSSRKLHLETTVASARASGVTAIRRAVGAVTVFA